LKRNAKIARVDHNAHFRAFFDVNGGNMTKFKRVKLEDGRVVLVRGVFSRAGETFALISKNREYGIWLINRSKWHLGPFKKMKVARAHWETFILGGLTLDDH